VDIELIDEGGIVMFVPRSDAGREFLRNESEGRQWRGESLCVDRHMSEGLAAAAVADGLEISGEGGIGSDDEADE
jgi:hypothetical protein